MNKLIPQPQCGAGVSPSWGSLPIRLNARFMLLPGLMVLVAEGTLCAQTTWYVDTQATGSPKTGLTWCKAFSDLSSALEVAFNGDEILVAGGIYRPDPTDLPHSREATFRLVENVKVIGGYAGCRGSSPDDRDPELYVTVLSGDLQGDDYFGGDRSDNAYQVVSASNVGNGTSLDGFTISGGNANGIGFPTGYRAGGGLYSIGDLVVIRCRFEDNQADVGGGIFNLEGNITVTDCVFERNRANYAGALSVFGYDTTASSTSQLPGEVTRHGAPKISGCGFIENSATEFAGALWVSGVAEDPSIRNCVFYGNRASSDGGAMVASGGTLQSSHNCLFAENEAGRYGGAVYSDVNTGFTNCSFVSNVASDGGGIYSARVAQRLTNCILWGNRSDAETLELAQASGAFPLASYTWVQGWTGLWGGVGNSGSDPLFVPGPAGCYYLAQIDAGAVADSPCVDAGDRDAANLQLHQLTTRQDEGFDQGLADVGYHHPINGTTLRLGDADYDGRLTLQDFAAFQDCFLSHESGDVPPRCRLFEFIADGKIDSADCAAFIAQVDGP